MTAPYRARAFGQGWQADLPLAAFDTAEQDAPGGSGDIGVHRVAALPARPVLSRSDRGEVYADGFRLWWQDHAVFDMTDGRRIAYLPGSAWDGALPAAFYATVTALTLAWRGALPFHACAIELDGRAVLIAGRSGTGKSSLVAGLLGLGARFVADDLTVVRLSDAGAPAVFRGRPGMRLHRDTAARVEATMRMPVAGDPRGKWLVRPHARTAHEMLPLDAILLLEGDAAPVTAVARIQLMGQNLFRPRWLAALPDHARRGRDLLSIAAATPLARFPAIAAFGAQPQAARARAALTCIEALIGRQLPAETTP